jgi:hypothetical protein
MATKKQPTAEQLDAALRSAERKAGSCRCNSELYLQMIDGRAIQEIRHHPLCPMRFELVKELAKLGVELGEATV